MARMTAYQHGQFSWVDLLSPDTSESRRFYCALFDWQCQDSPTDQGGFYSKFQQDGLDVCGMGAMSQQMKQAGLPAQWHNYITVDDAATVAGQVIALGGKIEMPPMQVMQAGRMAIFSDTVGARFSVWEAGEHNGANLVNEPNSLGWNELATREPDKAAAFYSALFGWHFEESDDGYREIKLGERSNGGIRAVGPDEPEGPAFWLPYFSVADCDASVARLVQLGGRAFMEPVDIEAGRFCMVADNRGAMMTIMRIHDPE